MKFILLTTIYFLWCFQGMTQQITKVDVPADGYYKATEELSFVVQFDQHINVDLSNGSPSFPLSIGTKTVDATYVSGSGSNDLTFSYTIQEGDEDPDGITPGTFIVLNGGTMKDVNGNDADLTLLNTDNTSGVLVSTTYPAVTLSTTAPALVNAPFTVDIVFSEAVSGLLASAFHLDNSAYVSEPQTTDNGLTYTMEIAPFTDGPLVINLGAALVQSTLTGNVNTASNTMSVTVDITDPALSSVDVPLNGYYNATQSLDFTVHYNEIVIVDTTAGKPYMAVNMEDTAVPAFYISGSGTTALLFRYTIQDGDMEMNGITLGAGLSLGGGGTIRDVAGNEAKLIFNNVGNTSGVFVNTAHPSVVLSTTAPAIVNKPFTVSVAFSEAVTDFTAGDLILTNAIAGILQTTDQINYTISITPSADGPVSVLLPADAAVNIGRNGNTTATLNRTADFTAPVINAGQSFSINEHMPVGTVVGTLTANGALQDWTITAGNAFAVDPLTGVITVKDVNVPAGTVTITVTVSDGLNVSLPVSVDITVIHVPVAPTDIILDNNTILEKGAISTLVGTLSAVTSEPGVTFTYSLVTGSSFSISGNQLQTAAVLGYNLYTVRVRATDNNGLSVEKDFSITLSQVNQAPSFDVIADQQLCFTTDPQTIQLTSVSATEVLQTVSLAATADQSYFNMLTVNAGGLLTYSLQPNASGDVHIIVTIKDNGGTLNGGIDSFNRTFTLTVNPLPVATISSNSGTTIAKGASLHLTASGGDTYRWDNAEQDAVIQVKPSVNTTYQVTATTIAGCSDTASISITVTDDFKVDATNVLTPNGDAKNDQWIIHDLENYPDNEVSIYDRSGRVVYHQKNYSNNWNGTTNGKPLAQGTYYYILTITGINKPVKGYISIIRD